MKHPQDHWHPPYLCIQESWCYLMSRIAQKWAIMHYSNGILSNFCTCANSGNQALFPSIKKKSLVLRLTQSASFTYSQVKWSWILWHLLAPFLSPIPQQGTLSACSYLSHSSYQHTLNTVPKSGGSLTAGRHWIEMNNISRHEDSAQED